MCWINIFNCINKNPEIFSVLIPNMVNIDRYDHKNKSSLGSSVFKCVKRSLSPKSLRIADLVSFHVHSFSVLFFLLLLLSFDPI